MTVNDSKKLSNTLRCHNHNTVHPQSYPKRCSDSVLLSYQMNTTITRLLTWICFMAKHVTETLFVKMMTYLSLYKYTFFVQVLKYSTQ